MEDFQAPTDQLIYSGKNPTNFRFIPESGEWNPGTYTFASEVVIVNPQTGQAVTILTDDLDVEIVVP